MHGCLGGLFHCTDGSCAANFSLCARPAALDKPACMTYSQNATSGLNTQIYSADGAHVLGSLTAAAGSMTVNAETPPVSLCSVADSTLRTYTGTYDFMISPVVTVNTTVPVTLPPTAPAALTLDVALPSSPPPDPNDYCLAVIDSATGAFTCVGGSISIALAPAWNAGPAIANNVTTLYRVTGHITSMTPAGSTFVFIRRSAQGTHCGGTTPHQCQDPAHSCVPRVTDCIATAPPSGAPAAALGDAWAGAAWGLM